MQNFPLSPPPWHLTGNGMVLLYRIPEKLNRERGFLSPYQVKGYKGWIGAVMMVDYKTSGVGPYQELLYIPGLFSLAGKLTFSISKIFVSKKESVQSGQENWGIPKELADFSLIYQENGALEFSVQQEGLKIFEAQVKPFGPRLPFSSSLLPPLLITQQHEDRLLQTLITASGRFQLARLQKLSIKPYFFPPVNRLKPWVAISIQDFHLLFPRPIIF